MRLWSSGGDLYGSAPDALRGLIEVRGLGVLPQAVLRLCAVDLAVLSCPTEEVERVPEPARVELIGLLRPQVRLACHEPGAVETLDRALDAALRGAL